MGFSGNEKGKILVPGHNFTVYIDGIFRISFSKISSINYDVETEPLVEGGTNDRVIILRKQKTSVRTMIFEQGVISNLANYPLGFTTADNLNSVTFGNIMRPGRRLYMPVFILVQDNLGIPRKFYTVNGCLVRKWSISDLDAQNSSIVVQRFEVDYQDIDVSDIGPVPL